MARNKAGHPLCYHERPGDSRALCTRWWCRYRLECGFYMVCLGLVALSTWLHSPNWRHGFELSAQPFHAVCENNGRCWNDWGQTWPQTPGSMPRLGPDV
jgi:hypothetical protein